MLKYAIKLCADSRILPRSIYARERRNLWNNACRGGSIPDLIHVHGRRGRGKPINSEHVSSIILAEVNLARLSIRCKITDSFESFRMEELYRGRCSKSVLIDDRPVFSLSKRPALASVSCTWHDFVVVPETASPLAWWTSHEQGNSFRRKSLSRTRGVYPSP